MAFLSIIFTHFLYSKQQPQHQQEQQPPEEKRVEDSLDNRQVYSDRIVYTLENSEESPETNQKERELIQVRTLLLTGVITIYFSYYALSSRSFILCSYFIF